MFKTRSLLTVLLGYALLGVAAHAADGPAPAEPDAGFLEFLGGVDGLADVNPNYLAQGNVARTGRHASRSRAGKAATTPAAAGQRHRE